MVIEGIKSSGVAYQGSTSGPESVTETDKTASAATSADVSDKQTDAPAAQENALSGEDEASDRRMRNRSHEKSGR